MKCQMFIGWDWSTLVSFGGEATHGKRNRLNSDNLSEKSSFEKIRNILMNINNIYVAT